MVIGLYRLLPHRSQNRMLLVASYLFYGAWDARFLLLIALSTVVDFLVAQRITAASEKKIAKRWCTLSIAVNLGLLGVFKYYDFFVESFAGLLSSLFGYEANLLSLGIVLPVGISFYTFQTLSYTIDVYRGHTKPTRDLLDFALYVSFFPQLVAGPIERSHRLLPQIVGPRKNREGDFAAGLYLVIAGLFAKIVVADNMAFVCNGIFAAPADQIGGIDRIVGIYAFAFQIYGDFYGYSSIARGISRWMGIDLMANFRMPYFARSPSDFWSRWHISLSSWLRDYLYIPLGGNRGSRLFTYRNLMLTMLLGGLWHGAGWTFLIWGLLHGVGLVVGRFIRDRRGPQAPVGRLARFIRIAFTFHLVCVGWVFFRAVDLDRALEVFGALGGSWTSAPSLDGGVVALLVLGMFLQFAPRGRADGCWRAFGRAPVVVQAAAVLVAILGIDLLGPDGVAPFIYFAF